MVCLGLTCWANSHILSRQQAFLQAANLACVLVEHQTLPYVRECTDQYEVQLGATLFVAYARMQAISAAIPPMQTRMVREASIRPPFRRWPVRRISLLLSGRQGSAVDLAGVGLAVSVD